MVRSSWSGKRHQGLPPHVTGEAGVGEEQDACLGCGAQGGGHSAGVRRQGLGVVAQPAKSKPLPGGRELAQCLPPSPAAEVLTLRKEQESVAALQSAREVGDAGARVRPSRPDEDEGQGIAGEVDDGHDAKKRLEHDPKSQAVVHDEQPCDQKGVAGPAVSRQHDNPSWTAGDVFLPR